MVFKIWHLTIRVEKKDYLVEIVRIGSSDTGQCVFTTVQYLIQIKTYIIVTWK